VTLEGITSTYALIGVYLSFKSDRGREVNPIEHTQRFYAFWCSLGTPGGYRAGTVHSICEKATISFPGLYNSEDYMST